MSDQLKPYLEQSAATDLPVMLQAKEKAKALMKNNPTKSNVEAVSKLRDEVVKLSSGEETSSPGGRLFSKRDEALIYLQARGFKIGRTKFHADCKKRLVPTTQSGQFEESVLLAYAANLPTVAREEDTGISNAARDRLEADAILKQVHAKRAQLKLENEQGLLMPRADHERDLAMRAQLFRNEIEGRDRRVAPKFVELIVSELAALEGVPQDVGVLLRDAGTGLVPEVTEFLLRDSGELMDAWAADREFVVELADDSGGDAA